MLIGLPFSTYQSRSPLELLRVYYPFLAYHGKDRVSQEFWNTIHKPILIQEEQKITVDFANENLRLQPVTTIRYRMMALAYDTMYTCYGSYRSRG